VPARKSHGNSRITVQVASPYSFGVSFVVPQTFLPLQVVEGASTKKKQEQQQTLLYFLDEIFNDLKEKKKFEQRKLTAKFTSRSISFCFATTLNERKVAFRFFSSISEN